MKQPIESEIINTFFKLYSSIRETFENRNEISSNLTLNQIQLLGYIYDHGQPQVTDIARHFKVTLPTVSINLNPLEELGYLRRVKDTEDRRIVRIIIEQTHKERMQRTTKQKERLMTQILSRLSDTEKQQFNKILQKLT